MNFNISDYVNQDQLLGWVRHALTVVGTYGVVAHNFSVDQWQTVVGATAVVVSVIWSHVVHKDNGSKGGSDAGTPPTAAAVVTQ